MKTSNDRRVGWLCQPARRHMVLALVVSAAALPQAAFAQRDTLAPLQGSSINEFYAARGGQPLWLQGSGEAAQRLIDLLRTADADGLDPAAYQPDMLDQEARRAGWGSDQGLLRADMMLSEAFVRYLSDLRHAPNVEMTWVDPELRPSAPSAFQLLGEAAAADSLDQYVADMRWMNPLYAGLRRAIADGSADNRSLLALNLERARALPPASGRFVIVNASAQQLTMWDHGRIVDTMRVVVGKPVYPTPMMAALIRFASLNPYWNVPPDLAAERVAPNVVKDGLPYLKTKGYEVLSSWDDDARAIDPSTVDWAAVAAGKTEVRIRQLPGPSNSMGKMKFMFPNAQGIYLHDTPDKNLLGEATRMYSGGCVRLEDAPRLARWLFDGQPPSTRSTTPEQRVDLPRPVPVFLTYLTAMPGDSGITYLPDVYNRDQSALAAMGSRPDAARR